MLASDSEVTMARLLVLWAVVVLLIVLLVVTLVIDALA
jgi:hypothetical protein